MIIQVTQNDFEEWRALAQKLWPDCTIEDLIEILQSPRQAGFLARSEAGVAIGFMNLSRGDDLKRTIALSGDAVVMLRRIYTYLVSSSCLAYLGSQ